MKTPTIILTAANRGDCSKVYSGVYLDAQFASEITQKCDSWDAFYSGAGPARSPVAIRCSLGGAREIITESGESVTPAAARALAKSLRVRIAENRVGPLSCVPDVGTGGFPILLAPDSCLRLARFQVTVRMLVTDVEELPDFQAFELIGARRHFRTRQELRRIAGIELPEPKTPARMTVYMDLDGADAVTDLLPLSLPVEFSRGVSRVLGMLSLMTQSGGVFQAELWLAVGENTPSLAIGDQLSRRVRVDALNGPVILEKSVAAIAGIT